MYDYQVCGESAAQSEWWPRGEKSTKWLHSPGGVSRGGFSSLSVSLHPSLTRLWACFLSVESGGLKKSPDKNPTRHHQTKIKLKVIKRHRPVIERLILWFKVCADGSFIVSALDWNHHLEPRKVLANVIVSGTSCTWAGGAAVIVVYLQSYNNSV